MPLKSVHAFGLQTTNLQLWPFIMMTMTTEVHQWNIATSDSRLGLAALSRLAA